MPADTDSDIFELFTNFSTKEKGFTILVNRYKERLYWHIRRMVVGHDDADDVLQNTFLKAWQGIENFRGESKLFTWLYRIATNECLTFLERQKRKAPHHLSYSENSLENKLKSDDYFDANIAEWKLHLAIQSLPEQQKLVFSLRYFEEMPYKAISEILQVSEGALKASFHHAARKVEQYLLNH